MHFDVSEEEIVRAKHPHELFLINLIFNHVFLLIAALMATSLQETLFTVPVLSVTILGYTFWRARRSVTRDSRFVTCHWQIAAKRSRLFAALWLAAGVVILGLLAVTGGDLKPAHYAVAGIFGLPTMGSMLVLILMESEAMQQASQRKVPQWAVERCSPRRAPVEA